MVKVFNADAVPMPLRFDTLEQARTYVARTPGTLWIVEATDEGERVAAVERAGTLSRRVAHRGRGEQHQGLEVDRLQIARRRVF